MTQPPTPTVAVGAVVLDDAGRLLVVRRGRPPAVGRWTVPGGRLEPGEGLTDGVRREVREETALDVEVGELVGHSEWTASGFHYVILDFAASVVGGDLAPGDDVTAAAFVTRSQLQALPTTDGLLDFLDRHGVALA